MKLLETETIFAFMDIGPIAKGHCLVIPKCESVHCFRSGKGSLPSRQYVQLRRAECGVQSAASSFVQYSGDADILDHAEKLTDLPDEHMSEILPSLKKLAAASVRRLISLQWYVS